MLFQPPPRHHLLVHEAHSERYSGYNVYDYPYYISYYSHPLRLPVLRHHTLLVVSSRFEYSSTWPPTRPSTEGPPSPKRSGTIDTVKTPPVALVSPEASIPIKELYRNGRKRTPMGVRDHYTFAHVLEGGRWASVGEDARGVAPRNFRPGRNLCASLHDAIHHSNPLVGGDETT